MSGHQPQAQGAFRPEDMKALIMTAPWSYDDTKDDVPVAFRNQIPASAKTNGQFHLIIGAEGLFLDEKNGWCRANFFRGGIQFPVLVPMSHVKIGAKWKSFEERLRQSRLITPAVEDVQHIHEPTVLDRHIRILWISIRDRRQEMRAIGLVDRVEQLAFGQNFNKNVDDIKRGFTPQARQRFSNGVPRIEDLASLPQVTREWPAPGAKVIYVRVYRNRAGGRRPGVYVGQVVRDALSRMREHENSIDQKNPHYNIARQSAPEDRLAIPIIVWEANDQVPVETVNMAEQTIVLLLNSYHGWVRTDRVMEHARNQYMFLNAVNNAARGMSQWPETDADGCNTLSPFFHLYRTSPIHCYHELSENTGRCVMTVYSQPKILAIQPGGQSEATLNVQRSDGTSVLFKLRFGQGAFPEGTPGYLVWEIMRNGRPHAFRYLGCPTIGPFENFDIAASLAIAFVWRDETSNQWKKTYTRLQMFGGAFAAGIPTSDVMKSLSPWKRCMDWIQLLDGIDYTGDLGIFSESLRFSSTDIRELVANHLDQKVEWRLRPRRNKAAPKQALFVDNSRRMKNLTSDWKTLTNLSSPPALTEQFWSSNKADSMSTGRLAHGGHAHASCDLCAYMFRKPRTLENPYLKCERDTRFTDIWICKSCALMARPCSWTARSHRIEYWGEGPPYLQGPKTVLGRSPTGPHKSLAFHAAFPGSYHVVDTPAPVGGSDGLLLLWDVADDDEGHNSDNDDLLNEIGDE